jgi:outer membrane protein OmpA-like peptidoglycan-associated protein
MIGFAAVFPLLWAGNGILPIRGAMKFLGVRAEQVDIRVNQSDYDKIQDAISFQEFAISDCSPRQASSHLIYGVNILWNRVGDFAYVELPEAANPDSAARFEVKSEDMVILNQTSLPCYRLKADALFKTKQSTLEPESLKLLKPLVADIQRRGNLASAKITGYADPRASDNPDNTTLSKNRAEAIKAWLLENFKLDPNQIETIGQGDQHPLVDCSKAKDADECNAPNRRVDLVANVTKDEKVDLGPFGNWLREKVIAILMSLSH